MTQTNRRARKYPEKNKTAVIIVNWNGLKLLKICLESLGKQKNAEFSIIVVDNGSSDGSQKYMKDYFSHIVLIELNENTGFAKGNNIGIQRAIEDGAENIITLNNDTQCSPTFIQKLIAASQGVKTGMVGAKLVNYFDRTKIDSAGIVLAEGGATNRGQGQIDRGQFTSRQFIFGPCAGAALYKTKALLSAAEGSSFFDERFFAYFEDVDLAWRIRLQGWDCAYAPMALVYHVHAATGGRNPFLKKYLSRRNSIRVLIKNVPFRYWLKFIQTEHVRIPGKKKSESLNAKQKAKLLIMLASHFAVGTIPLLVQRYNILSRSTINLQTVEQWIGK